MTSARGIRLVLAVILLQVLIASAQQVGYLDLSQPLIDRAPSAKGNEAVGASEEFFTVVCDETTSEPPEKLVLVLQWLSANKFQENDDVEAVVKIHNLGERPVLIPWSTPRFEDEIVPGFSDQEYDWASIRLWLASGGKQEREVELAGGATLFGKPGEGESYRRLRPGEWVLVRFRVEVRCWGSTSCPPFEVDEKARLSAEWSEYHYRRTQERCLSEGLHPSRRRLQSRSWDVAVVERQTDSASE